jgi:hypothetical protein
MEVVRVRDLMVRQAQRQQAAPAQDDRAARMAENARRHIAEQTDSTSWMNPPKIRDHLTSYYDANPVEIQEVLDLLETATHFSRSDFENGSAAVTALATIRGGEL